MNDEENQALDEQNQMLTLEELNIEELEHRLELAASNAVCTCGKYA